MNFEHEALWTVFSQMQAPYFEPPKPNCWLQGIPELGGLNWHFWPWSKAGSRRLVANVSLNGPWGKEHVRRGSKPCQPRLGLQFALTWGWTKPGARSILPGSQCVIENPAYNTALLVIGFACLLNVDACRGLQISDGCRDICRTKSTFDRLRRPWSLRAKAPWTKCKAASYCKSRIPRPAWRKGRDKIRREEASGMGHCRVAAIQSIASALSWADQSERMPQEQTRKRWVKECWR